MTMTRGTFLTRNEIERRGTRTVSALLRGIQDVRVERSARGRTIVRSTEASGPGCPNGMLGFLDGTEMTPLAGSDEGTRLPALSWIGPSTDNLVRLTHDRTNGSRATAVRSPRMTDIDRVKVSSVLAVEVYAWPNSAPPEFQMPGAECGLVVIWTAGAGHPVRA
jgi:hypothetical protein